MANPFRVEDERGPPLHAFPGYLSAVLYFNDTPLFRARNSQSFDPLMEYMRETSEERNEETLDTIEKAGEFLQIFCTPVSGWEPYDSVNPFLIRYYITQFFGDPFYAERYITYLKESERREVRYAVKAALTEKAALIISLL